MVKAHAALLKGIAALAKGSFRLVDLKNPIERYAFEREAEHRWALEDIDGTLRTLGTKVSTVPRDNLLRWQAWEGRFLQKFGEEHNFTLIVRHHIVHWMAECSEINESLRLSVRF